MYGAQVAAGRRASFSISVAVLLSAGLAVAVFPRLLQAVTDEPGNVATDAQQQLPAIPGQEQLEALHPEIAPALAVLWQTSETDESRLQALQKLRPLIAGLSGDEAARFRRQLLRWLDLLEASIAAGAVPDLSPTAGDFQQPLQSSVAALRNSATPEQQPLLQQLPLEPLVTSPVPADALNAFITSTRQHPEQSPEQRAFLLSPAVQQVKADAEKALAAGLTWPEETAARAARTATLRTLVAEVLRNEIRPSADISDRIRSHWRLLRTRFPKSADVLWPAMSQYVMNHNLHLNLSENLLGRLISDFRTESGCVADFILGARVTGTQTTSVRVTADVTASPDTAAFQLKLSGNTRSETTARKDPATVFTSGNHYFWIDKPFEFDGTRVTLGTSRFSVDTNSQTRGFRTKYDGIPLIGMVVRGAAKKQIAASKPRSEAITAQKLRSQAQPEFDSETNEQFSKVNADIEKTLAGLRAKGAAPDLINARSSHSHAAISSRSLGIARVGGSVAPEFPLTADGGSFQVHESAVNALLDALSLHGRIIPAEQLTAEIEKSLSQLLQREIKLRKDPVEEAPAADAEPASPASTTAESAPAAENQSPNADEPAADEPPTFWVFDGRDPIQVQFGGGRATVILQAAIRREGQPDIARHSILIPLAIELRDDKLVLTPDPVRIIRTSRTSVAVANQIRNIVQKRIQPGETSAVLNLQPNAPEPLPLTITGLTLEDGWLTLQVR